MFGRNGKGQTVTKTGNVAVELAQDRKFRREIADAVRHAAVARNRATRRAGLMATATRLAADEDVRRELRELASNLQKARSRVERARASERGHGLRNTLMFVVAAGGAAVAVPQTRAWLANRMSGLTLGRRPRVITDSIDVEVPVSTAYNQWTQFEEFPQFMEGVEEVRQLDDTTLRWVASIGGKRAEWQAEILEQHADRQISWVTGEGKRTRGTVSFESLGPARTRIELSMSYSAEGPRELIGSAAGLDARRVRGDLERFKTFIESRGTETGAWRGDVSGGTTAPTDASL